MVSFQSECQQAEETGRADVAVKERRQEKLIPQLEGSQVGEVPSYRRKRLGSNTSAPTFLNLTLNLSIYFSLTPSLLM